MTQRVGLREQSGAGSASYTFIPEANSQVTAYAGR
jgi:hypothetical protein